MGAVLNNDWKTEAWHTGLLIGFVFFLFAANGYPWPGLAAGLAAYWLRTLIHLRRLQKWINNPDPSKTPDAEGIWGDVLNDLSRRERLHTQQIKDLEDNANYTREALTSLSQAVVMLSPSGEIEWCNSAAGRLLGLNFPQDKGQILTNLWRSPEFVTFFNGGNYDRGIEITSPVSKKLTLWCEVSEFGDDERLLFVRDLTVLKRLESMRTDFVANVSHELRTPLTVISGYIETLGSTDAIDNPTIAKALSEMATQSARMDALVRDLLTLTRLESVPHADDLDNVDLTDLAKAVAEEVGVGKSKDIAIRIDMPDGVKVNGHEKELHSAISNLVSNAYKYTPEGGEISIGWLLAEDGSAKLSVKDDGIGIESKHVTRLTERFYRVDSGRSALTGGTGLGLAIVKHVLLRHDSRLSITSKIGEGSTFSCCFPAERVV